ncbi:MAG: hypothetical protein EOM12_03720 [Verrucomicrobiae bacterium]|nr:hypothetical protein [Verrucomicrobiae bacterium]
MNPERDLTILVAHCDDEFLFMWPFLARAKKIVCLTSDANNPRRAWCKGRKKAFMEVCDLVGAEGVCLDHSSRFFSLPNAELAAVVAQARECLYGSSLIATHNAWGEYGHLDHVMCHQIARQTCAKVLTTNAVVRADWYPVVPYLQGKNIDHVKNDMLFHERCMGIYRGHGAMGWSWEPLREVSVVEVQG